MHRTGDREAVLGLAVVDRVAAHDRHPSLCGHRGTAPEDLPQRLGPQSLERVGDQVERGQRRPPMA